MISFIVPVFYKNKNSFIYKRSLELIAKFQNHPKIELIIADSSYSPKLQAQAKNIIIVHTKLHQKTFSLAQARNQAVQYATKKYLFFLDVDMDYSLEFEKLLFDEIQNKLETNQLNFFQIPFLYLTPKGTQLFEKNHQLVTLKESFLKGKTCLVESISITNPSIVISKQYFQQIGGFDEDFYGHGCEDYILLHKLAAFNSHSKRNQDYYTDFKAHFLGDSKGFRKYFAYYSLPYFFKDLILLHRWHPRPFYNNFYSRRIPNETLLQSKMKQCDEDYKGKIWHSTKPLINLKEYITNLMLQHHYDPKEYPGFFSYAEGVKPPKKSINNKIRKLLTRPKDFFRDIKLFRKQK